MIDPLQYGFSVKKQKEKDFYNKSDIGQALKSFSVYKYVLMSIIIQQ